MNKFRPFLWVILIAAAVCAAGFGLYLKKSAGVEHPHAGDFYFCPMHPFYTSAKPGNCPICQMKLVQKEKEEHSSGPDFAGPKILSLKELMAMKPGEICLLHKCKMGKCMMVMTEKIAKSGKCPHCGEDLGVVIKDFSPTGYMPVKLSQEKQAVVGIKTAPAEKRELIKSIRSSGKIAYDPALYQTQQEFIQSLEAYQKAKGGGIPEIMEQASKLVDSARLKLKLMGLGENLIAEIEKAGKPDRSLLYGEPGGTVWLYAPIYEYEIPLVKVGQEVKVSVPAVADKNFKGVIRSIDSVVDPMTRSVRVRAQLDNPDGFLKPEMYVNAALEIHLGDDLSVPSEAVFSTGDKDIIFVSRPDGVFEPREVVLGAKTEEFQQVKSGLSEGEQVVISGNFLIDSESRLKAALQSMESESAGGHSHGS